MKKLLVAFLAFVSIVGTAKGATTLYEYYQEKGQNLPSVEERAGIASTMGIDGYTGSQSQNIALLSYLQGEGTPLGADLPQQYALFDGYLASGITKTDTSLTLTSGTTRDGVALSGRICFTIDVNTPTAEYVCGTAAGTAISSLERGVLPSDPTATSTDYAFAHRRFATISITDFPFNALVRRLLQGTDDLPATLSYASSTSLGVMDKETLATITYVDNVGAGGFTASNVGTNYGLKALGTSPETVGIDLASLSGLRFDNAYNLQIATSTTDDIYVDIDNTFKLDKTNNYTWTGTHTFSGNTTMATTTVAGGHLIGDNFGGNGIDGALTIGAGATTTLSFDSATYLVKNYTSLSIPNTASLSFSNPASGGSVAYIKVQGDATIGGYINLEGMGSAGGSGGTAGAANASGGGGGGGTSATLTLDDTTHGGGGGGGGNTNGTAGTAGAAGNALSNKFLYTTPSAVNLTRGTYMLTPGQGGGGGGAGASGSGSPTGTTGGAGGNGGGVIILEVGGTLTFTGSIDIDGANGVAGNNGGQGGRDASGGGGGGGSAGMAMIVYNYISINTGIISAKGGSGGNGGVSAQAGIDGDSGGGGGGAGGTSYTAQGGVGGAGGGTNGNGVNGTGGGAGAGGGGGGGMGNSQNVSTVAIGGGSSSDSNHYLIIKAF